MTLTPTDWAALTIMVLAAIALAYRDDPRWWRWLRRKWSGALNAWFVQWRMRRRTWIRVPAPDQHSAGIRVTRRDINTGNWT